MIQYYIYIYFYFFTYTLNFGICVESHAVVRNTREGIPGWLSGLALPPAQGLILETQDGVQHRAPCMESASPSSSLSLSLCVS